MRPSQKSGRGRGKGNRNKNANHSPNRVYESAGPEGKVRGTPQQIIDKYLALARDNQLSGDRVASENFLQHAEHYTRILVAAQEAAAERRDQMNQQPQPNDGGPREDRQPQPQPQQNGAAPVVEVAPVSDEQPPTDGLGAIDAAQSPQPEIVETPEAKAKPAPARPRRPRPKPPVEAEAAPKADSEPPKVESAAPTEDAAES